MAETKSNDSSDTISMAYPPPYGVYLDGELVAEHETREAAEVCRQRLFKPRETQAMRDKQRHALQAPIAAPKYRVMYLKNGKEHCSAWLYRKEHAQQGLAMMRSKYGKRNAIIYVD